MLGGFPAGVVEKLSGFGRLACGVVVPLPWFANIPPDGADVAGVAPPPPKRLPVLGCWFALGVVWKGEVVRCCMLFPAVGKRPPPLELGAEVAFTLPKFQLVPPADVLGVCEPNAPPVFSEVLPNRLGAAELVAGGVPDCCWLFVKLKPAVEGLFVLLKMLEVLPPPPNRLPPPDVAVLPNKLPLDDAAAGCAPLVAVLPKGFELCPPLVALLLLLPPAVPKRLPLPPALLPPCCPKLKFCAIAPGILLKADSGSRNTSFGFSS